MRNKRFLMKLITMETKTSNNNAYHKWDWGKPTALEPPWVRLFHGRPQKKSLAASGAFWCIEGGARAAVLSLSLSPFFSVLLLSKQSLSQSARGFGTVNNRKPTTPVKRTVRTKTLLSCIHWRVLCKVEKLSNSMAAGFRCLYYQW